MIIDTTELETAWIFTPAQWRETMFATGVFSQVDSAEQWIRRHRQSGMLTQYPLDTSAYDWAVSRGYFKPKNDDQRSPQFIGTFSDAHQEHFHYEDGERI